MAERDPRAPRIRPVRTVNRIRPDYGGNVDIGPLLDEKSDTGHEHPYQLLSEKDQPDGYPSLDDDGKVPVAELPTGTTAGTVALGDHTHSLDDLTDVDLTGQADGDFLGRVGGVWVPVDPPAGGDVNRKIDVFSVPDDSDDTFVLTYVPIDDSWNMMLNGVRVHASEFTVDGVVVTITDPTDLFLGADTQGSPWELEIQYDHEGVEPVGSGLAVSDASNLGQLDMLIPDGTAVGDLMVAHIVTAGAATLTPPAGWDLEVTESQSGGSFPYGSCKDFIYTRVAEAADLGDTSTWNSSADLCGGIVVVPGGSVFTYIGVSKSNVNNTPVSHPAADIPAGGIGLFFAAAGNDVAGGLSTSGGTSDWSESVNFQKAAAAETITTGAHSVTSTFNAEAARIAHTVVVT